MKRKPFQEQLSKFSLLGELPKVETGLEEAWENLKKCTEPFEVRDIIKQQQETINRQQAENEALQMELEVTRDSLGDTRTELNTAETEIERLQDDNKYLQDRRWKELCEVKSEAIKEFTDLAIKTIRKNVTPIPQQKYLVERCIQEINNLVKQKVGEE